MLQEIILSFFNREFNDFYNVWKEIPEKELAYLLKNYDLNKIDRIIVVGSGAIPYTGIYFARRTDKTVYLIEKNSLAFFACSNLLRRLKIDNIKLTKASGERFSDYSNGLIIISLHTTSKQRVLEQALHSNGNNIIVVRQPLKQEINVYESIFLHGLKFATIQQPYNFESVILCNNS